MRKKTSPMHTSLHFVKATTQPRLLFAFSSLCNRLLIAFIPSGALKAPSLFLSSAPPPLHPGPESSRLFQVHVRTSSSMIWREECVLETCRGVYAAARLHVCTHDPPSPLPDWVYSSAAILGGGDVSCRAEQF